MKNREVAQAFLWEQEAKGSNFYSEKNNGKFILFSYGYHFPICVMLEDGTRLFNKSGYSQTTSVHKGEIARALGFNSFNDMIQKEPKTILLTTEELKDIIRDKGINNEADYLARNL